MSVLNDSAWREGRLVNQHIASKVTRAGSAFALLLVAGGAVWRLASIISGPGIHQETFAWVVIGALVVSTLMVLISITLPRSSQFRVWAWMAAVLAWVTASTFLLLECLTVPHSWGITGPSLPVYAGVALASMVRLFDVTVEQNALEHRVRPAPGTAVTP
jgi:hypothetical protein